MLPADAFLYLHEKKLPLILSFPFEEERGHVITGRGLCYIEKIYDSAKVILGRFSPHRTLICVKNNRCCFTNFEAFGKSYSCIMDDIIVDRGKIIAAIPQIMNSYHRRFIRVEPSAKLPVVLYMFSPEYGTMSVTVKDISERGIGFLSPVLISTGQPIVCGIRFPIQGDTFIMSKAAVKYRIDAPSRTPLNIKNGTTEQLHGSLACYGIELFPHAMDENKIRIYIMQRDVEIRRLLQEL
ncbi:MAG TPA: hypothetical protein VK435_01335 [Thermodesulfovibrionales bacterium]|nr:hypothetical protein [Thermodesulfovibrionales bacterium]